MVRSKFLCKCDRVSCESGGGRDAVSRRTEEDKVNFFLSCWIVELSKINYLCTLFGLSKSSFIHILHTLKLIIV